MNAETVNVKFADSLKSWNKGERLEVPLVLSRESREQIALFGLEPFIDQCRQSLEGMLGPVSYTHLLRQKDDFLILTHGRPDGDTIGSGSALCRLLRGLGKQAFLLPNEDLTPRLGFLCGDLLAPEGFVPGAVVATDVATRELLCKNAAPFGDRVDPVSYTHLPTVGAIAGGAHKLIEQGAGDGHRLQGKFQNEAAKNGAHPQRKGEEQKGAPAKAAALGGSAQMMHRMEHQKNPAEEGQHGQGRRGPQGKMCIRDRAYTDTITAGWNTVAYRVRSYDSYNATSTYVTSETRTVDNNAIPVITSSTTSGTDLGTKEDGFDLTYTVTDADSDTVTVKAVSYTHLDVYKRQHHGGPAPG